MFGSDILEVSIGIVFVFVLVSTVCSAVREAIEAGLKTRASYLEFGIRQLLGDATGERLARQLFNHPLIYSLFAGDYVPGPEGKRRRLWHRGRNLPSYIPSRSFAVALLDLVGRAESGSDDFTPLSLQQIRSSATSIESPIVKRALLLAIDSAQGNAERARENVEAWFNSAMDRVSSWYKRSTQWLIFWIALAIAIGANVNTLAVADYLYRHDAVRSAIVSTVEKTAGTASEGTYQQAMQQLQDLHLPIGWPHTSPTTSAPPSLWDDIFSPLLGWLITAFAATLGAPFWFDLLKKIMVIRSAVKPHDLGSEERASAPRTVQQPVAAIVPAASIEPLVEGEIDPCTVGGAAATPDDRLPAAEGGVA